MIRTTLLCSAILQAGAWHGTPPGDAPADAEFTFAHIGDPQIGYGDGAFQGARRFRALGDALDADPPAFGIVVGDLVQDRTWREEWLLARALPSFRLPLALLPGNHDVLDTATLEAWRTERGPDWFHFVYADCAFLCLDSETLRDRTFDAALGRAQWSWIEETLEREVRRRHIFVALHRPPASREAWGPRLLDLCERFGVDAILAGHTHDTSEFEDGAVPVYTVGGTARVTDERGYGYRRFQVTKDGFHQEYVRTASPPDHWLLRGWTPRLIDPSPEHWALTLCFAAAAWAARGARRRWAGAGARGPFGALALTFLLLALNLQLDLDELFKTTALHVAGSRAVYEHRRVLQALTLGALALAALPLAFLVLRRALAGGRWPLLAVLGAGLPVASFAIHTVSHHGLESFLYSAGRGALYLFEGMSALLSFLAARRAQAPTPVD